MMDHFSGIRRQKRLGDVFEPSPLRSILDLSAAIAGLEYGPTGQKIYYTEEEITIEMPDGTPYTHLLRMKNIVFPKRAFDGQLEEWVIRLPVRMEDTDEWSRIFGGWSEQERRKRMAMEELAM